MAAASGNGPLAPHMTPCAPHQHHKWIGYNPPASGCNFLGGWGCVCPQSAPLFRRWWIATTFGEFWGPYTPLTATKIISTCLGGCCWSIRCAGAEGKASFGALGDHYRQRWSWLAMAVLVDVGSWRHTSDQTMIGIVKIVYGSFFYSNVYPIQSWHLTQQLNKEELDLHTLLFSWFLCPVFCGSLPLGSYVETCSSFYVFSGPRWLVGWIGYWTPIKLPCRLSGFHCWTPLPPHH